MTLQKTVYIGPFVHSISLQELDICSSGAIGVDETGKISFVDRDVPASNEDSYDARKGDGWTAAKVVRVKGNGFFFPGFIDTHIHASQYPNAGIFGKSTLMDWLNTYTFPLESSFADLALARRIYTRVVARTLAHGTTTAAYYATTHVPATNLLADICLAAGQRALVGRVCMDRLSPPDYRDQSTAQAVEDSEKCIKHVRAIDPSASLITPVLTPRFAPSCTGATLAALGELANESGVPVQTHVAENKAEIKLVGELFPEADNYVAVYGEAGLLTPKTILAHCVHLSEAEVELIKAREAKVSHCPASNTALTSGAARVRRLLDAGVTVGLGTDVSGGYSASVLEEARQAILVSRHVAMAEGDEAKLAVEEALFLATRGGARVCGLEAKVGGFEVGLEWDAQMVVLGDVVGDAGAVSRGNVDLFFADMGWENKVHKWVFTGDDRNTAAVWVKGRLVHGDESVGR